MQRSLIAIEAELQAVDRRAAMAVMNGAPEVTKTRLFWERVHLAREAGRAMQLRDPERRSGGDRRHAP